MIRQPQRPLAEASACRQQDRRRPDGGAGHHVRRVVGAEEDTGETDERGHDPHQPRRPRVRGAEIPRHDHRVGRVRRGHRPQIGGDVGPDLPGVAEPGRCGERVLPERAKEVVRGVERVQPGLGVRGGEGGVGRGCEVGRAQPGPGAAQQHLHRVDDRPRQPDGRQPIRQSTPPRPVERQDQKERQDDRASLAELLDGLHLAPDVPRQVLPHRRQRLEQPPIEGPEEADRDGAQERGPHPITSPAGARPVPQRGDGRQRRRRDETGPTDPRREAAVIVGLRAPRSDRHP